MEMISNNTGHISVTYTHFKQYVCADTNLFIFLLITESLMRLVSAEIMKVMNYTVLSIVSE